MRPVAFEGRGPWEPTEVGRDREEHIVVRWKGWSKGVVPLLVQSLKVSDGLLYAVAVLKEEIANHSL